MRVYAKTREEYFKAADEREDDVRALDALVRENAPSLKPVLYESMTGTGLGYGVVSYRTKSMKEPAECPLVGIALQKHHIGLYICVVQDGVYMAEQYGPELGKVSVGRSCVRIKKLEDVDRQTLEAMISDIEARFVSGEKLFGL